MIETIKPNCYDCRWRQPLGGSAHSQCIHPKVMEHDEEGAPLRGVLAVLQGTPGPRSLFETIGVDGDEVAIRRGWFAWPWNFDPTWLRKCDGFEAKAQEKSSTTGGGK